MLLVHTNDFTVFKLLNLKWAKLKQTTGIKRHQWFPFLNDDFYVKHLLSDTIPKIWAFKCGNLIFWDTHTYTAPLWIITFSALTFYKKKIFFHRHQLVRKNSYFWTNVNSFLCHFRTPLNEVWFLYVTGLTSDGIKIFIFCQISSVISTFIIIFYFYICLLRLYIS